VRASRRRLVVAAAAVALTAILLPRAGVAGATAPTRFRLPAITHIWNIVLENEDYATTFGDPAADPYLAVSLPSEGALLENYDGTGHESNDNYIALVSGQPPNPGNQGDCQVYSGFADSSITHGIEGGVGCVYPSKIKTIGNQLTHRGLEWKAYEQDMGNVPSREAAECGHPVLDSQDTTQDAVSGDGYASRHDPFVYFESVTGNAAYCDDHVVALGSTSGAMPSSAPPGETGLVTDLGSAATTPSYSFITPTLCNDGHDYPCANQPSGSSALADIDTFLETWIPVITASPAYHQGGLIEVTFDESDGAQSDSTACCNEVAGPASPLPGITGPGGGKVGAVLLSPFIHPGTRSSTPYNHYSTLATDERLLGLERLGEAKTTSALFGADVFTNEGG